jgi:hypothetical protein
VATTIPPIPTNEEKERILINKFREYRQFKVNWAERDGEGWINYREKNYNEVILPIAIKSNIISYTNEHEGTVSFTDQFISFLINAAQVKKTIDKQKLLGSLAFMEYYAAFEVANYLGLAYDEFCSLPSKDPDKLKLIIDLGEIVHRLINSEIYERLALAQEEQMKDRAEFRKSRIKEIETYSVLFDYK